MIDLSVCLIGGSHFQPSILPADKGRTAVVMDKGKYEQRMNEMLADPRRYERHKDVPIQYTFTIHTYPLAATYCCCTVFVCITLLYQCFCYYPEMLCDHFDGMYCCLQKCSETISMVRLHFKQQID